MICPECGGETSEWHRSVDLEVHGGLELIILTCDESDCNWVTVHDWRLVKQYKMRLENKEEVK